MKVYIARFETAGEKFIGIYATEPEAEASLAKYQARYAGQYFNGEITPAVLPYEEWL